MSEPTDADLIAGLEMDAQAWERIKDDDPVMPPLYRARAKRARAAADRLAALTAAGEWTSEPPKVPGWWWVRTPDQADPYPIRVFKHPSAGLIVHWHGDFRGMAVAKLSADLKVEWRGPLSPAAPPPVPAAGEESDFLAFMTDELDRFPCLHGPAGNGAHAKTPPMMWPELIRCIVAKAKQDAHPAPATPPPVPAEVVAAAGRVKAHGEAGGHTQTQYDVYREVIKAGQPSVQLVAAYRRDLQRLADYAVAELVARHVLKGEGT